MDREGLDRLVRRDVRDDRVAEAFASLDRADFVPDAYRSVAYRDRPVGLPRGQTTSQPSLIARMVEAADLHSGDRVLEVGTGYGFQTALMSRLAAQVVSVERHAELAEAARKNLARCNISNATVVVGDGWEGCASFAPYDAVVVSAAATEVPRALGDQLAEGGRLVIPLERGGSDDVVRLTKRAGELGDEDLITPARFVPLVHDDAGLS
jgi:protein-L-isoaspartate(D-aspartate) O-methyltransferase